MNTTMIGMYLAETAFMGLVFATIGALSRALWETRRGEVNGDHT